jgi:Domain of unknown function (DUF5979)
MSARHLHRGGIVALLIGILLLAGAPLAASAEEPLAPDPALEEPVAPNEVTPPDDVAGEDPAPPETAPETPPPASDFPPTEEPAEEPAEEPVVEPGDDTAADGTGESRARTPAPEASSTHASAPVPEASQHPANLKPAHVGATNPGFQTGSCPDNPFNDNTWGWHFVLPGNSTTFVSLSASFQNAGIITQFLSFPTGKHAYVWTPGPDTLLGATAVVDGPETEFNLSHVCTGTTPPDEGALSVVKQIQGVPGGPFTINVTCTLDDETVVDVDLIFAGAGQQQVNNIPASATCNVTETDDGGATSVSYSQDPPQNIVIVADEVAGPVTVTNTFDEQPAVGALKVTKEIEGPVPPGAQFLVHVTCTLNNVTVVDQDLPLFTTDGESQSITNIPAGAECVVEETGNFGATVSYSPDPPTVTIVEKKTAEVTVTNTYETGALRIIKELAGNASPPDDVEFQVRVRCEFANQEVVDEILTFGSGGGEDTISGIPAGAQCSIEEIEDGGATNVEISPDAVQIVAETTLDSTVTNTFTEDPPPSPNMVAPATAAPSSGAVSGTSSGGNLAFTGAGALPLAVAGAVLLVLGAAAVLAARRRENAATL